MTQLLIIALTAPFMAWFAIEVFRMPERNRKLQRKPFNCIPCLSVWIALVLLILPNQVSEWLFVLSTAGCVGAWLSK